jgi:two-component system response regulator HydG
MAKDSIILVVDDERNHADGVVEALDKLCAKAVAVYSGKDALEILHNENVDCIITDLKLDGDVDGLSILDEAKKLNPDTEVILVTAYATIDTCKDAIRRGAFDYLVKPIDIDQLRALTLQACRKAETARRRFKTDRSEKQDFIFDGVRGKSRKMQGIFEILKRIAPTNLPLLIEGESGTGKELLAKAVHENSQRADNLFRPVNCAGLTETLLESELFGHVRGAFTGAAGDRKGLFETADKGTLFLDEIGDMAPNSQAKLLRVIEDGIVIPVGSNKPVKVDVRIITATNQDLTKLIEEKKFRQDLYFRIKGISVVLPPLRERAEDIPIFVDYFIKQASMEIGSKVAGITDAAMNILKSCDWPGNIRQLRNVIRTMVVMSSRDTLDIHDIPPEISQRRQLMPAAGPVEQTAGLSLAELEKQAIIETLSRTGNNRQQTARILGIGERTLYRKIKEYNLG